MGSPASRGIGVQPEDREGRHGFVQQGGQALRPGAIARDGNRATCRTGVGDGLAVGEPDAVAGPVTGVPGGVVRTGAGAAGRGAGAVDDADG
jgi:hypothetical protein